MSRQYEIQRYRYGKVVAYTAFALVPWDKPKERTLPSGARVTMGNGPGHHGALHFRTASHLLEYAKFNRINVINLGSEAWRPLEGTIIPK